MDNSKWKTKNIQLTHRMQEKKREMKKQNKQKTK